MTIWEPDISGQSGPKYQAIADLLAKDLSTGRLREGDRLPPHRDLAWKLGVTVGTVSRGYQEAERRGLVTGIVGRGTFVRRAGPTPPMSDPDAETIYTTRHLAEPSENSPVDLKLITPAAPRDDSLLSETLREIADLGDFRDLMSYGPEAGLKRHRAVAAGWLSRSGLEASPDELVITNGAMHAILLCAMALARPGDTVAVEQLTYPGFRYLATQCQLRVKGLAMDEHGLLPEAFDAACREEQISFLYLVPTLHNPTTAVMPLERRQEIAAIARRHGVPVVEDDIYGMLPPERPAPITGMLPELGFYCNGASKNLAPGMRVGFLRVPPAYHERVLAGMRVSTWMAPPLGVEVVSRWIESGTADRLADWHRDEAVERQLLATEILAGLDFQTHPHAYHLWLKLPPPLRSNEVVLAAERRGVLVTGAEHFVAGGGHAPGAVRVCLAPESDRGRLTRGLTTLVDILRNPATATEAII